MILKIENEIDFSNVTIINKLWKQFNSDGRVVLYFNNGSKMICEHKKGFIFDHASIPPFIPFFRHWRFSKKLEIPSYVHDILFLHHYTSVQYSAHIMNIIMEFEKVHNLKRSFIYTAVNGAIAQRIWDNPNERDYINKNYCSVGTI